MKWLMVRLLWTEGDRTTLQAASRALYKHVSQELIGTKFYLLDAGKLPAVREALAVYDVPEDALVIITPQADEHFARVLSNNRRHLLNELADTLNEIASKVSRGVRVTYKLLNPARALHEALKDTSESDIIAQIGSILEQLEQWDYQTERQRGAKHLRNAAKYILKHGD